MELYEKISTEYLELNSCGEQIIDHLSRSSARKLGRVDYHILYIIEGSCYVQLNGKEKRIKAGNIIFFRPHEPQLYRFSADEYNLSLYLHFSGTGCEELTKKCGLTNTITEIGINKRLISLFSRLREEYLFKRPHHSTLCAGLLMQFLSMIGQNIDSYNSVVPHDAEDRMHRICQKMHHEYTANHPISYYADACFLSESRFSHAFKAYTGRSPKAYLLLLRADYAVRLLETTNLSLQEISNQIGIDDTNYFSRLIKKHTGYPPLHFRKNRE